MEWSEVERMELHCVLLFHSEAPSIYTIRNHLVTYSTAHTSFIAITISQYARFSFLSKQREPLHQKGGVKGRDGKWDRGVEGGRGQGGAKSKSREWYVRVGISLFLMATNNRFVFMALDAPRILFNKYHHL